MIPRKRALIRISSMNSCPPSICGETLINRKMEHTFLTCRDRLWKALASNNQRRENIMQSMIYLFASIKSVTTLFIQIIA